ncbi:DUF362 domain-containing protein [Methanosarcina horonobensis]|uniref:DUF362 domain-containing protein n=1 Tax=Methanosarcina horonobensis TaxID=418008 RepID=UPI0022B90F69|nr:DUF362 domain-containing protein [Methanosarcina horonobensis]
MAKSVLEADVIISLPKLKTHELTLYTGAVKKLFWDCPSKKSESRHMLWKIVTVLGMQLLIFILLSSSSFSYGRCGWNGGEWSF